VETGKAILHLTALFSFYRLPISMREYNVVRENPIFQIFYILSYLYWFLVVFPFPIYIIFAPYLLMTKTINLKYKQSWFLQVGLSHD
jgi:hypothetical protein